MGHEIKKYSLDDHRMKKRSNEKSIQWKYVFFFSFFHRCAKWLFIVRVYPCSCSLSLFCVSSHIFICRQSDFIRQRQNSERWNSSSFLTTADEWLNKFSVCDGRRDDGREKNRRQTKTTVSRESWNSFLHLILDVYRDQDKIWLGQRNTAAVRYAWTAFRIMITYVAWKLEII